MSTKLVMLVLCAAGCACAQELTPREQDLLKKIEQLQERVAALENRLAASPAPAQPAAATPPPAAAPVAANAPAPSPAPGAPSVLSQVDYGVTVDGYYAFNFDHPYTGMNILRAYDVSSNSFSLNQATFVVEKTPNPSAGSPWGARVDLQFGQATQTLQGSPANEARPEIYRDVFQAYGTYVAPLGKGLNIDFGKWSSSLGIEGNYTKDEMNYSRSYLFNYLPYYHFGFRTSYSFNDKVNVTWWLVNGEQQSEDFNAFKSNAFLINLKPAKSISWNLNYYFGQEGRPLLPGLPAPQGKTHIFDTYLTWSATPNTTLVLEGDYVVARVNPESAPGHVSAGAAYIRRQLPRSYALAARAEYLSDRGGLFSGTTQALKEITFTGERKFAEGFLVRAEYRRDFSNQSYFPTAGQTEDKKYQDTATLGLVWWFGSKEGSW